MLCSLLDVGIARLTSEPCLRRCPGCLEHAGSRFHVVALSSGTILFPVCSHGHMQVTSAFRVWSSARVIRVITAVVQRREDRGTAQRSSLHLLSRTHKVWPDMSRPESETEELLAATQGFDHLFANRLEDARTVFSSKNSPFHLMGLGVCAFLQAALGMEVCIIR